MLRTSNAPVQRWRIDFVRHVAADNENQSWAYDALMNDANGFPQLGDARFWPSFEGIAVAGRSSKPLPRAEIFALESTGRDRDRYQQATAAFAPAGTRHVGLDLNVPLTGTIAPQEFRRGLSEYRPFFSQGANFFDPSGRSRSTGRRTNSSILRESGRSTAARSSKARTGTSNSACSTSRARASTIR